MKPREFKLNLALSPSLNVTRLRGYLRERFHRLYTSKGRAILRRNSWRTLATKKAWEGWQR